MASTEPLPDPGLPAYRMSIVDNAMVCADATKTSIVWAFCERVRAMEAVGADRASAEAAIAAIRTEMLAAVDSATAVAEKMAGEWWA